jgi:hypothetical protein
LYYSSFKTATRACLEAKSFKEYTIYCSQDLISGMQWIKPFRCKRKRRTGTRISNRHRRRRGGEVKVEGKKENKRSGIRREGA